MYGKLPSFIVECLLYLSCIYCDDITGMLSGTRYQYYIYHLCLWFWQLFTFVTFVAFFRFVNHFFIFHLHYDCDHQEFVAKKKILFTLQQVMFALQQVMFALQQVMQQALSITKWTGRESHLSMCNHWLVLHNIHWSHRLDKSSDCARVVLKNQK